MIVSCNLYSVKKVMIKSHGWLMGFTCSADRDHFWNSQTAAARDGDNDANVIVET